LLVRDDDVVAGLASDDGSDGVADREELDDVVAKAAAASSDISNVVDPYSTVSMERSIRVMD